MHTLASGFHHQPFSHCAELTPGVATVTIATGAKATTMPVAETTNRGPHEGLPEGPCLDFGWLSSLCRAPNGARSPGPRNRVRQAALIGDASQHQEYEAIIDTLDVHEGLRTALYLGGIVVFPIAGATYFPLGALIAQECADALAQEGAHPPNDRLHRHNHAEGAGGPGEPCLQLRSGGDPRAVHRLLRRHAAQLGVELLTVIPGRDRLFELSFLRRTGTGIGTAALGQAPRHTP